MASVFPGAIDSFTDPLSTSPLNSPSHAGQHQDLNDAVEKLETKLGIGSSPASGAANGMSLVANGSGTTTWAHSGGLVFIKSDTITSGTSKEITSIFSAAYTNYLILLDNVVTTAGVGILMRMGTNNANYYWGGITTNYATNAVVGENGNNTDVLATGCVADTSGTSSAMINIYRPFLTTRTTYNAQGTDSRVGGAGVRSYSGFLNNTTSYTSASFLIVGANFTSCNVTVYGYRI